MAYYTGTITNANPAQEYITQIEAALALYNAIGTPDNNTWSKVEEVTSVTNFTYEVWKNSGSGVQLPNTFGTDFYLAFGRDNAAGSGTVYVSAGEGYLSGTDSIVRPASGTTTTMTVNSDYSFGDTTNGLTLRGTGVSRLLIPGLPTSGFEYHIVINRDGIFLGAKFSTTDLMTYAGLFTPAFSYASFGVPLCIGARGPSTTYQNFGTSSTIVGTSRHPNLATGSNANQPWQHITTDWGNAAGDYQTVDRFTNKAEGVLRTLQPTAASPALSGFTHGWLKNCFRLAGPSTSRLGDTENFESKVHLAAGTFLSLSPGANQMWIDTEAA